MGQGQLQNLDIINTLLRPGARGSSQNIPPGHGGASPPESQDRLEIQSSLPQAVQAGINLPPGVILRLELDFPRLQLRNRPPFQGYQIFNQLRGVKPGGQTINTKSGHFSLSS